MTNMGPLVSELELRFQAAGPTERPTLALELGWHVCNRDPERALILAATAASDPALASLAEIVRGAARLQLEPAAVEGAPGAPPTEPVWRLRWTLLAAGCALMSSTSDLGAVEGLLLDALRACGEVELHPRDEANLHNSLGRILNQLGRPAEALGWFEAARALYEVAQDRVGEATLHVNIGNVKDDLGDVTGALQAYEASLELHAASGSTRQLGLVYLNIAEVRHRMRDLDEARRYAELGERSAAAANDLHVRRHALGALGRLAVEAGDVELGLGPIEAGLALAEEMGDRGWAAAFRGQRAGLLLHQDRAADALEALGAPPPEGTVTWLADEYHLAHAAVLAALGRHAEVVQVLERDEGRGPAWFNGAPDRVVDLFADSYRALGQPECAFELVRERLRYVERRQVDLARARAASVAREVDLATARLRAQRADEAQEDLRAQLLRAQRLEAVGQLASGVAHDFNNLLTVILGEADAIADCADRPDLVSASVDTISHAAIRAGGLTRQLLAFARKSPMTPGPTQLEEVLAEVEPIVRSAVGRSVEVEFDVPGRPLPPVHADASLLEQVILNLALNARDAMPDGGRLTIGARPRGQTAADLVVRDTGVGIPPELTGRIFDPFFTTKGPTQGSGLGLAMVWGVTTQLGGTVEVFSQVGSGTEFVLRLPPA